MRWLGGPLLLAAALLPPRPAAAGLVGEPCAPPANRATELWSQDAATGQLRSATTGLCATAQAPLPVPDGTLVAMAACVAGGDPTQAFAYVAANSTLVLAGQPSACLNLAAYGTAPGTTAWLYGCSASGCRGNCDWSAAPAALPFANATLTNGNSGLCLQDGSPLPALPHTCEAGSPAAALPFCDVSLDVGARVNDLLARLSPAQKLQQWDIGTGGFAFQADLNLKAFHWDFTCSKYHRPPTARHHQPPPAHLTLCLTRRRPQPACPNPAVHGVNYPNGVPNAPPLNVSVFPHAIAQAASFDADLVTRLSRATLYEARTVGQIIYRASGGEVWAGTSCDGGPLANSVHDPRWGRISECYGEDPVLAAGIGVAATRALQNRSADGRWLGTSQVIRHWLGYHMADPDLPRGGEEEISLHAFHDQQAPIYRGMLVGGDAEGLMCAYASFSIGASPGGGPAPLVPSCVHPFLWEQLRESWEWSGFVTTDCCDSISSMVSDHHFFPNVSAAALASIEAGVGVYFGFNDGLVEAVGDLLASGALDSALFDDRLRRTLLTRFRMGEFDAGASNPQYPYSAAYDESQLDGPAHRALAREAVADSLVLLENENGALPLPALGAGMTLSVIGPFADCDVADEGAGGDRDSPLRCSYGHTYEGTSGAVSTILSAAREAAAAAGFSVRYAQGSNIVTAFNGSAGLAAAAAAAAAADATVLVLGLGELLEVEGRDRSTLALPAAQQALLAAVAAAATRGPLVVVVVSAGLVDLGAVAYGGTAHARLQSFYAGAETGHGTFDVLLGLVAPSARLPLTAYAEPYLAALGDTIANFSMVSSTGVGRTCEYTPRGPPGALNGADLPNTNNHVALAPYIPIAPAQTATLSTTRRSWTIFLGSVSRSQHSSTVTSQSPSSLRAPARARPRTRPWRPSGLRCVTRAPSLRARSCNFTSRCRMELRRSLRSAARPSHCARCRPSSRRTRFPRARACASMPRCSGAPRSPPRRSASASSRAQLAPTTISLRRATCPSIQRGRATWPRCALTSQRGQKAVKRAEF